MWYSGRAEDDKNEQAELNIAIENEQDSGGDALRINFLLHKAPVQRTHEDIEEIHSLVSELTFLSQLSPDQQYDLCRVIRTEVYEDGEIVFTAGDPADRVYIVAQHGKFYSYSHSLIDVERFRQLRSSRSADSSSISLLRRASSKGKPDYFGCKARSMLHKKKDELMNTVLVLPADAPDADPANWKMIEIYAERGGTVTYQSVVSVEDGELRGQTSNQRHVVGNMRDCRRVERLAFPGFSFCIRLQLRSGKDFVFSVPTEDERWAWSDYVTSFASTHHDMSRALVKTMKRSAVFKPGSSFGKREVSSVHSFSAEIRRRTCTVSSQGESRVFVIERQDFLSLVLERELFSMQERVDILRRTAVFGSKGNQVVFHSAQALVPIICKSGDVICSKGEKVKGLYIVFRGFLTIYDDEDSFSVLDGEAIFEDHKPEGGLEPADWNELAQGKSKAAPSSSLNGHVVVGKLACTDTFGNESMTVDSTNSFTLVASDSAIIFLLPVKLLHEALGRQRSTVGQQRVSQAPSHEDEWIQDSQAAFPIDVADQPSSYSFAEDMHSRSSSPIMPNSPVRHNDLVSQDDSEGKGRKGAPRITLSNAGLFLGATLANPFQTMPPLGHILDESYSNEKPSLRTSAKAMLGIRRDDSETSDASFDLTRSAAERRSRDWAMLGGSR
eukprot:3234809-Rhodomonas_salina.1